MSARIYEFRQIGAKETARSLLELAAANVQLAKSEVYAAKATVGGAKGRSYDAHVKARVAQLKEQARAERQAQLAAERSAKASARASERAEQTKTRTAEREAKRREQIAQREAIAIRRAHEKQAREQRRAEERAARAMRPRTSLTTLVGDRMRGIAGNLAIGLGMAGGVAGAAAWAGGQVTDLTQQAYRQRALNEQRARALAVTGGERGSAAQLLADADATAASVRGTRTEDVLAGQQRFVAMTGRLDLAKSLGRTMATAARASGASEEDIAATMATFQQKFGIEDDASMQAALANMIQGGKSGAFELSDASRYFQEMGASGARFGLDKGASGVQKLGAMAQLARMSTGSGAEAATGVQAMLRQLVKKSSTIKDMAGREVVFQDATHTNTNDIVDVLAQTISAAKGDQVKLQKVFATEGMAGASEFIKRFNEAANALGKNATEADKMAAGEKAVRDAFEQLSGSAGQWSNVLADAAVMTDSAAAKYQTAFEKVVSDAGSKLTPAMNQLAEHFDVLLAPVTSFAEVMADAVGALAGFIEFMKRHNLIDDVAPSAERAARTERIAKIGSRLNDLNRPDSQLTSAERAEKKRLEQERADLEIVNARGDRDSLNKPREAKPKSLVERALFGGLIGAGLDQLPQDGKARSVIDTGLGIGKDSILQMLTGGASALPGAIKGADAAFDLANLSDKMGAGEIKMSAKGLDQAAQKLAAAADKLATQGGARPATSLPGT